MDSWCPSCGYAVEPGTRFCGGCGTQLAAEGGAPVAQSPTVTLQSPAAPFQGQLAPAAPLPAPVAPAAPPPPPAGSPAPWPPPPSVGPDTEPQAPLSDTVERMLRPQGLFQNRLPAPAEWQQPYPPAPGAFPPPGAGFPQANPYQQGTPYPPPPPGAPYPAGSQYPPTGAFQQPAPPAWGPAPTGALPPAPPGPPGAGFAPGGQYPQGGPYQDPYGNGQFAGGQNGQDQFAGGQFPGGQFGPGQFGAGAQFAPDGAPLGSGGSGGPGLLARLPFKRPKRPLVPLGIAAAIVIVVVVALTLSSQGGSSSGADGATAASAATPNATASSGTTLTQSQAASALSGLLSQSGGDRSDVSAAVVDVEGCGKSLAKDSQVFSKAAANRHTLLTKLAQLPGRSALSPAMITDLTGAWQASATVDADLAKWAQDQVGHCKKRNTKDPNYTATIPFDSQATNDKNAFVQLWNPLAKKDGLPTRQSSDL